MRLTKLQAVNRILRGASEAPVSTLEDTQLNENLIALQLLDEALIQEQMHGLAWNTSVRKWEPDETTNRIELPDDLLQVEAWANDDQDNSNEDVVDKYDPSEDKFFLYDTANDTWEFDNDIVLRTVRYVEFEHLPVAVQFQIADMVSVMYQQITVGDRTMHEVLQGAYNLSRAKGRAADWRAKRLNMFKDGRSNGPRRARRGVARPWH